MIELCRLIFKVYPQIKERIQFWQLLSFLDKNEDKLLIISENNNLKGVALFARISDETLWKIEYGFLDLKNSIDILTVLIDKGENIHFLFAISDSYKTIKEGIRRIIKQENPKTISWYNQEMTKFNKFKRSKLCLQS